MKTDPIQIPQLWPGSFDHRGNYGWQIDLPADLENLTDNDIEPSRSPLVLLENGISLGPGHSIHAAIFDEGHGYYSFWKGNLYFSTSDNSNPNQNGRTYTIIHMMEHALAVRAPNSDVLEPSNFERSDEHCFLEPLLVDPAIDRIFSFPVSHHVRSDTPSSAACRQRLRAMQRRILVLAQSRSGSTHLAYLLRRLGIDCQEYLHPDHSGMYQPGVSTAGALIKIFDSVPNRIFCSKEGIDRIMPLFEIGEFPEHISHWNFIYLTRKNLIRQAISLLIAEQTGQWFSKGYKTSDVRYENLTFSAIAERINNIFYARQLTERFLSIFEIDPLRLSYEELNSSPEICLDRISAFIELGDCETKPLSEDESHRPDIQSTELNRMLEERFRAEMKRRLCQRGGFVEILLTPDIVAK